MARGIFFGGGRGPGSFGGGQGAGGNGGGAADNPNVAGVAAKVVTEFGEKGFALNSHAVPVQRAATSAPPPVSSQPVAVGSSAETSQTIQPPLPRLRAYILVDGHGLAALQHLKTLIHELDDATQSRVELAAIGNPDHSGKNAREQRTPEERARLRTQGAQYVERVFREGKESFHVVEESLEQAKQVGVNREALPCFAFYDSRDNRLLFVTHIHDAWFDSEPARIAFGRALERWFCEPRLKNLLERFNQGADGGDLLAELQCLGPSIGLSVASVTGNTRGMTLEIPPSAILVVNEATREAKYRGHSLDIGPTAFRFLLELSRLPDQFVPTETLARTVTPLSPPADLIVWGRNRRQEVIKAFRELAKRGLIPDDENETRKLIVGRKEAYRLGLTKNEAWTIPA